LFGALDAVNDRLSARRDDFTITLDSKWLSGSMLSPYSFNPNFTMASPSFINFTYQGDDLPAAGRLADQRFVNLNKR